MLKGPFKITEKKIGRILKGGIEKNEIVKLYINGLKNSNKRLTILINF